MIQRQKLIEASPERSRRVARPLEDINLASAREKSIGGNVIMITFKTSARPEAL